MQIIPGTDATLVTTTYEAQIFELANFCVINQREPTKNPDGLEYFRIQIEDYGVLARIEYEFPLAIEDLGRGNGYGFTGNEYLLNSGFTPGTDGTLAITSTLGYFYKLIIAAQIAEAPLGETNVNRISGNHNSDNSIFSGSCNFEAYQQLSPQGERITLIKPYIPNPAP